MERKEIMNTQQEKTAIECINNALLNDTAVNSYSVKAERLLEEKQLNYKKFWAFKFTDEQKIESAVRACLDSIKRSVNDNLLDFKREKSTNNILFTYTLEKCDTLRDIDSPSRLMRGIIFFDLSEVKENQQ